MNSEKDPARKAKLAEVLAEIEPILTKHDVGALIFLHTPGLTRVHMALEPSYSALKIIREGSGVTFGIDPLKGNGDMLKTVGTIVSAMDMIASFEQGLYEYAAKFKSLREATANITGININVDK